MGVFKSLGYIQHMSNPRMYTVSTVCMNNYDKKSKGPHPGIAWGQEANKVRATDTSCSIGIGVGH